MNRILKIFAALLIVALFGIVLSRAVVPESPRIYKKIDAYLAQPGAFGGMTLRQMKFELASALINENKPDAAIDVLLDIIKEGRTAENIYGQRRPLIAADYFFLGRYYEQLAHAFELKGDLASRDKALRKMEQAQTAEKKLRPEQEAREKRREKRERDSILN